MKRNTSIGKYFLQLLVCIVLLAALGFFLLWDARSESEKSQKLQQEMIDMKENTPSDQGQTTDENTGGTDQQTQSNSAEPETIETSAQPAVTAEPRAQAAGVACWGDTFYSGDDAGYSYTAALQQVLNENGFSIPVASKTLEAADTLSVMKMAGVSQADLDAYVAAHQEAAGGSAPVTEVSIRDLTEEEMARTELEYLPVLFMGYYGGWNYDPQELIEQQQKVLDTFGTYKDQFVIVGLSPADGSVDTAAYDAALSAAWGEHYISAVSVCGSPVLSVEGQSELASAIYQKLIDLGYLTKA